MMSNDNNIKNKILLMTFVISNIPSLFFDSNFRINLSLFIERSTRIDFFVMYYVNAINFLIMAYCLYDNEGISKKVSKFILIMCVVDFLHLLLFAGKGLGISKIGITLLIYWLSNFLKK